MIDVSNTVFSLSGPKIAEPNSYLKFLDSDLFVFGLPRSSNTYFYANLSLAYPNKKILPHIHDFGFASSLSSQDKVIVLIRNPRDLVNSWALMSYGNFYAPNTPNPPNMDVEKYIIFQIEELLEWARPMESDEFKNLNKLVINFEDVLSDLNLVNRKISLKFSDLGEPIEVSSQEVKKEVVDSVHSKVREDYLSYAGWVPDPSRVQNDLVRVALSNPKVEKVISKLESYYSDLRLIAI